MKRVLLSTIPDEEFIDRDGIGGHSYDRRDTYQAWTCALDHGDRLSVTCPATGLRFLQENVPGVEILEYPSWRQYRDALASERWDMVGISFYTWSSPLAIHMAELARQAGVPEVWGGNYGVLSPGLEGHFTRLVRGAGEDVLHRYVHGTPLPRLKHPPMFGRSQFRDLSAGVGYLYSKRGCNIGCTFCSTPVFNPSEEPLSLEALNTALDAYQEQGVAQVIIYDETFFLDNDQADVVIDALARRNLPWLCLTRADRIRGRIGELTERCMDGAIVGIESFRNANLADVRKRDDAFQVRETLRELKRHGRRALGTFILGFEKDSAETIREDVEQLAAEDLFVCQLTLLTPFPGTALWRQMEQRGLLRAEDLSQLDVYHLVWKHPSLSPEEARELVAWGQRRVNRPEVIEQKIRDEMKGRMWEAMRAGRRPRAIAPDNGTSRC